MIIEKGPGKDFLSENHTRQFMRQEFFQPKLANREKRDEPGADDDAMKRARKFVSAVRKSKAKGLLSEETRARILREFPEIRKVD